MAIYRTSSQPLRPTNTRRLARLIVSRFPYRSIDWSKPSRVIKGELKCSSSHLHNLRRLMKQTAPPPGRPPRNRAGDQPVKVSPTIVARTRIDWANADWEKQDVDIADALGCSRERVRRVRLKLKIPPSPHHLKRRKRSKVSLIAKALNDMGQHAERTPNEAIAAKFGVSKHCVVMARMAAGILFKSPTKYPWELMEFALPNKVLGEIWRINDPPSAHPGHVVAVHRNKLKLGPSQFDLRCPSAKSNWRFQALRDIECRKAAEYWRKQTKASDEERSAEMLREWVRSHCA